MLGHVTKASRLDFESQPAAASSAVAERARNTSTGGVALPHRLGGSRRPIGERDRPAIGNQSQDRDLVESPFYRGRPGGPVGDSPWTRAQADLWAGEDSGGQRGFDVELVPSGFLGPRQKITMADLEGSGREQEAWNVMRLIRLTQARLVWKVRQCSCGFWFFARTPQNQWHQKACRLEAQNSEDWKAARAKYMRDYYAKHYKK